MSRLRWICVLALMLGQAQAATPTPLQERVEELVRAIEAQVADVPAISAEALLAMKSRPLLLDVRTPAEREVSVIPGAIFTLDQVSAGTRVVVYCTVGLRSGNAARRLRARGINAVNLRGGILGWLAKGGTLVNPQGQPTTAVHVYGRRWGAVPDKVKAVW